MQLISKRFLAFGLVATSMSSTLFSHTAAANADASALCRETALQYAHFADTNQRDKFGALFTKEGTLTSSAGTSKPASATQDSRPARTTRHIATNHIVVNTDGQLTGTSYFTYYFNPKVQDSPLPITGQPAAVGVYRDKYVIENGKCKFTERVAEVTFAGE